MELHSDCSLIQVLVADSNQTQSQLLGSALRRQHHMRVTCCRGELSDCLEVLRSTPTDIVILGHDTFDHARLIESIRGIHRVYPKIGLILFIGGYDRHLVVNAIRAGARGLFCSQVQPFRSLCRCISVVHQGQVWANTEQIGYLVEALSSTVPQRVLNAKGESLLTQRELQIVNLVAEGLPNRTIAEELGIKENSAKKALLRIYNKLGVYNRVELALYFLAHSGDIGLVDKTPGARVQPITAGKSLRLIDDRRKAGNGQCSFDPSAPGTKYIRVE